MAERFVDYDPLWGTTTWFSHDPETDITTIRTETQESFTQSILDQNKDSYNHDYNRGYTKSRDFKHVAKIPPQVILQWLQEGIDVFDKNDWPAVKRKLNSSEWVHLRTSPGTI